MKHSIVCPACTRTFSIWTYSIGMADITEYRCDRCPNTAAFTAPYNRPLSGVVLPPCSCGGQFRQESLHRCPLCNAELTIDQIKAQINWWGSADGRPGVSIGVVHNLDEVRGEFVVKSMRPAC